MDSVPADVRERERFINEVDRNFSVIAPAGVGKTQAIVERIRQLALKHHHGGEDGLSRLVVVTFTTRAAAEMQQRARNAILGAGVSSVTLSLFNQAFFGTIHSFCVTLLKSYGFHLGLPSHFDVLEEDTELWHRFLQDRLAEVPDEEYESGVDRRALRLVPWHRVLEIARQLPARNSLPSLEPLGDAPSGQELLNFPEKGNGAANVRKNKAAFREWKTAWESEDFFVGFPKAAGSGAFVLKWDELFSPFRRRAMGHVLRMASWVSDEYQRYRVEQGWLSFDDQLRLASRLVRLPIPGRLIREAGYRIILDEAQDTDPEQFDVLMEISRSPEATEPWRETRENPPLPGCFCMVGDPQQSIYGTRTELRHYREAHEYLCAVCDDAEVVFQVTFRCDRRIVEAANGIFPEVLHGEKGQAKFVPLRERPDAGDGQVCRWEMGVPDGCEAGDGLRVFEAMRYEAEWLAKRVAEAGLERLRAQRWSEVAVLCPRRAWLSQLYRAFERAGMRVDVHSTDMIQGDSPVYAWAVGLLTVLAEPMNGFEIVGVLREVFGYSDQELYDFADGEGWIRFCIGGETSGKGPVAETLSMLDGLRKRCERLPLSEAVKLILEKTELRERLIELARCEQEGDFSQRLFDGIDIEREVETLLSWAEQAEEEKKLLGEFAEGLRKGFQAPGRAEKVREDAIQLITCQKAKGLQWQAVIIPFLNAKVGFHSPRYPMVTAHPRSGRAEVLFAKEDRSEEIKEAERAQREQELARLCYVSMTRARHTLVLVDDSKLFQCVGKEKGDWSFAELMRLKGAEKICLFENELEAGSADAGMAYVEKREEEQPSPEPGRRLDAAAASYLRRTLPHRLARDVTREEPEVRSEADPDWPIPTENHPGIQYGTWWHHLMEKLPWQAGEDAWDRVFAEQKVDSPMPERAEQEFGLLKKSDVISQLTRERVVIHSEMPFLYKLSADACMEGIVDLAAYSPYESEWLIIDWKTDRGSTLEQLRDKYGPQLSAYMEALKALTKKPVRGALYSTAQGLAVEVREGV